MEKLKTNKWKGERINPNKSWQSEFNKAKTDSEKINIIAKRLGLK